MQDLSAKAPETSSRAMKAGDPEYLDRMVAAAAAEKPNRG